MEVQIHYCNAVFWIYSCDNAISTGCFAGADFVHFVLSATFCSPVVHGPSMYGFIAHTNNVHPDLLQRTGNKKTETDNDNHEQQGQ